MFWEPFAGDGGVLAAAGQQENSIGGVAGNFTVHHKHFPSQHGFSPLNRTSIESGTDRCVKKNSMCKISSKVSHLLKEKKGKIEEKPSLPAVCLVRRVEPHKGLLWTPFLFPLFSLYLHVRALCFVPLYKYPSWHFVVCVALERNKGCGRSENIRLELNPSENPEIHENGS